MASRPHKTAAKRYYTIARLVVKDLLIVFVAGQNDSKVQAWNRKKKRIERISETLAGAIADVPHKWLQHCIVTGRRQDGQEYSKLEILAPPHPVMQSQIANSCNELHKEMLTKFNKMHQLTAAWIVSPVGEELNDTELNEILTKFGAYDFKAQWECEND